MENAINEISNLISKKSSKDKTKFYEIRAGVEKVKQCRRYIRVSTALDDDFMKKFTENKDIKLKLGPPKVQEPIVLKENKIFVYNRVMFWSSKTYNWLNNEHRLQNMKFLMDKNSFYRNLLYWTININQNNQDNILSMFKELVIGDVGKVYLKNEENKWCCIMKEHGLIRVYGCEEFGIDYEILYKYNWNLGLMNYMFIGSTVNICEISLKKKQIRIELENKIYVERPRYRVEIIGLLTNDSKRELQKYLGNLEKGEYLKENSKGETKKKWS